VGALAKILARAGRTAVRPDAGGWDPAWHIGPIRDLTPEEIRPRLGWLVRRRRDVDWLYGRLADDDSRRLLVDLLAHRLAGSARVAFGPDRRTREELTRFARRALVPEPGQAIPLYDLAPIGLDLKVRAAPMFAIHTFVLEQYRHPSIAEANPRPGDHAVDGGAFWGDTALWLADQCGPEGRVTAFEVDPVSLPVLEANLAANGEAGARVEVRQEALWDTAGELALRQAGAASTVGAGEGQPVRAITLDSLVEAGELERIDFVKLDVEGAELRVLKGMERTLRRDRPRLAIAAYHRWDDLFELPRWLSAAAPEYRFALTHRSLHQLDTVLFAWP
jgi:FkbM family methyltransferase